MSVFDCAMDRTVSLNSLSFLHSLLDLVIPLKTELAVELQEKGRVRFWLQADISANGKVDYVFNDNKISQGEVSEQLTIMNPKYFVCIYLSDLY